MSNPANTLYWHVVIPFSSLSCMCMVAQHGGWPVGNFQPPLSKNPRSIAVVSTKVTVKGTKGFYYHCGDSAL